PCAPTGGERIGLTLIVPEVCPFAEIGFAENDCTSRAQFLDERRVRRNLATINRERACGRLHVVLRGDVVFNKKRNAMQRAAHISGAPFVIKSSSNRN